VHGGGNTAGRTEQSKVEGEKELEREGGWGWGCRRLGRLVLEDRAAPERERGAVGRGSCAPAIVGRVATGEHT